MSYRLPVNDPVHATIRFADLVGGDFGLSVRLKARIAGEDQYVYLPGNAPDVLTLLHTAGVLGALPEAMPASDDRKGIALAVAHPDVVLTLEKSEPKARARLVVTRNGASQAPSPTAASDAASGARRATAGHPATSTATAAPLPSLDDRRAATVTSFHAAVNATIRELVPAFHAGGLTVDADVAYRCAFTLFKSWQDHGLA